MKEIIGIIGGGYINFAQVVAMLTAAAHFATGEVLTAVTGKTAIYRLFSDSGKSFRSWVNSAMADDAFRARAAEYTGKAIGLPDGWRNRGQMNEAFLFGGPVVKKATKKGEVKGFASPLAMLALVGPVPGHYHFTNRDNEEVHRPSPAESLLYWNYPTIVEAGTPIVQVIMTADDETGEAKAWAVDDPTEILFFDGPGKVGRRAPTRFEPPRPTGGAGL